LLSAAYTVLVAIGQHAQDATHAVEQTVHSATQASHGAADAVSHGHHEVASVFWIWPFTILLLCIALLPLIPSTHHWWEENKNKFLVAITLGLITCAYYFMRGFGLHGAAPGWDTLKLVLNHAILVDYIPFIVLLFSLYTISGGISLRGDLRAHPLTNTAFLAIGAAIASFIGTTGASMLLIRPLLQTNSERRYVKHTVIFFIFLVSNIGGCLLPIGDPPLFLGYLRGVPFAWTFSLWLPWATVVLIVLAIYYVWDTIAYRKEDPEAIKLDETTRRPLSLKGNFNFVLLLGVIFAVAFLVPGKEIFGWKLPNIYLREIVQLILSGASMWLTSGKIRKANSFNFFAIIEVAALFIGIFLAMQVPLEILNAKGSELGLTQPWHFFWATGTLSSFLDNAPTYVVFFETAGALPASGGEMMTGLMTATGSIPIALLAAISLGAVFMGSMSYIGNGPNFMVKSIAEQSGIKMPSFFGYMGYSVVILIPVFVVVTLLFLL
jgi:Na+/H+ antiporter NhaD/arsenite permease-like protein